MNTSKTHLQADQFSLKTNWKLAERLLYNQGCKKGPRGIGQEGKKSNQVGSPGKGLRGKGRLHGRRSTLGSEQFKPHAGLPVPGVQHREDEPLELTGAPVGRTNRRAVGSLHPAREKHVCGGLLSAGQGAGLFQWLPRFPPRHVPQPETRELPSPADFTSQLHSGLRAVTTGEGARPPPALAQPAHQKQPCSLTAPGLHSPHPDRDQSPHGPHLPCGMAPQQGGGGRGWRQAWL